MPAWPSKCPYSDRKARAHFFLKQKTISSSSDNKTFKKCVAIMRFFLPHLHMLAKTFCGSIMGLGVLRELLACFLFVRARIPPSTLCFSLPADHLSQLTQHVLLGLDSVITVLFFSKVAPEDQRLVFVSSLIDLGVSGAPGELTTETPLGEIRMAQLQFCLTFLNGVEDLSPEGQAALLTPLPTLTSLGDSLAAKIVRLIEACPPAYLHLPQPTEDDGTFQDALYSRLQASLSAFLVMAALSSPQTVETLVFHNLLAQTRHLPLVLAFVDAWVFLLRQADHLVEPHFFLITDLLLRGDQLPSRPVALHAHTRILALFGPNIPRNYLDEIGLSDRPSLLDALTPQQLELWKTLARYLPADMSWGAALRNRIHTRCLALLGDIFAANTLDSRHFVQISLLADALVLVTEEGRQTITLTGNTGTPSLVTLVEDLLCLLNPSNFTQSPDVLPLVSYLHAFIRHHLTCSFNLLLLLLFFTCSSPPDWTRPSGLPACARFNSRPSRLSESLPLRCDCWREHR